METRNFKWNITKCYPCFHGYNDAIQLIQQLEISRLFGVEHLVVHMLTASEFIHALLRHYQKVYASKIV